MAECFIVIIVLHGFSNLADDLGPVCRRQLRPHLAEMAGIGLPVPPGFTITTEQCVLYLAEATTAPST